MKYLYLLLLLVGLVCSVFAQTPTSLHVTDFGAVCNGVANDTAAIQAAFAAALAPGSKYREVSFPAGICRANVVLQNVKGLHIKGQSRLATTIRAIGSEPALRINGFWYSKVSGITFDTEESLSSKGVVEIDGGTPYIGVQANTFADCLFSGAGVISGGLSDYAFTMVRQGGSGAQGSENLFLNCHFANAKQALYAQFGYNALQNTFMGGNMQSAKYGFYVAAGSVMVYSMGFQLATVGARNYIESGGADCVFLNSANDRSRIQDCRTESFSFLKTGNGHSVILDNLHFTGGGIPEWAAGVAYSQGTLVRGKTSGNGNGRLYIALTSGTSSNTEPIWPAVNTAFGYSGSMNGGSNTFSCGSCGNLYAGYSGYGIVVAEAGGTNVSLYSSLAAWNSNSQWQLADVATTTTSSASYRIGPTVIDSGVKWMQFDYDEISIGGPTTIRDCSLGYGRVNTGQSAQFRDLYSLNIENNFFAREDWLRGIGLNYPDVRARIDNNTLRLNGGPNTGKAASAYYLTDRNGGSALVGYKSPFALGSQALVWNGGSGAVNYPVIGFIPDLLNSRLDYFGKLRIGGNDLSNLVFGAVSFSASTATTVTFATPLPTNTYRVLLTPGGNIVAWVSGKTVNGFTVNTPAAFTGNVDWMVVR